MSFDLAESFFLQPQRPLQEPRLSKDDDVVDVDRPSHHYLTSAAPNEEGVAADALDAIEVLEDEE